MVIFVAALFFFYFLKPREKNITLQGTLTSKTYPGPPEYSSIPDGDRADDCWILKLDKESFEIVKNMSMLELTNASSWPNPCEVTLCLSEEMKFFCNDNINQEIAVEGYLFHAHTAHHYTSVLIDVKKLSRQTVVIP